MESGRRGSRPSMRGLKFTQDDDVQVPTGVQVRVGLRVQAPTTCAFATWVHECDWSAQRHGRSPGVIPSSLTTLWLLSASALLPPASGSTRKQTRSPGLGLGAGRPTRYPEHLALLRLSTAGARSLSAGWHLEQFVHLLTTHCSRHSAQGHGLAPLQASVPLAERIPVVIRFHPGFVTPPLTAVKRWRLTSAPTQELCHQTTGSGSNLLDAQVLPSHA